MTSLRGAAWAGRCESARNSTRRAPSHLMGQHRWATHQPSDTRLFHPHPL